jgi:putative transposase
VLAIRVVPKSANGVEAALLTFDVCRPFYMQVKGTAKTDWRWGGLPETLDLTEVPVRVGRTWLSPNFSTLQGEHRVPSVQPDAIHTDHGGIFVSKTFRAVLANLQIDLLLNRGGKANDNPHVERWHETIQRGLQQIPGYKGRNVSQRGRLVSEEPLLTAPQLQLHLRQWIALDYHRTPHTGIILPEQFDADLCPLELWDAMVEMTGRIDVPQTPDLIYQFLPVKWGKIGHAGVEFGDLVYDSPVLDPYRSALSEPFRAEDDAAPFFVDPQDMSRIWFRDRESGRVEPIEWRGADRIHAPMAKAIVNVACKRIRDRGGNRVIDRNTATQQILDELTQITATPTRPELRKMVAAARDRVEQDRIDHGESQAAQNRLNPPAPAAPPDFSTRGAWPNLLEEG